MIAMKNIESVADSTMQLIEDRVASYKNTESKTSLKLLRTIAFYIRDHYGRDVLSDICKPIDSISLLKGSGWINAEELEEFLSKVYEYFDHDEKIFQDACIYRLSDAYGPAKYLLWASTPKTVFIQATKTFDMITTSVEKCTIIEEGSNWLRAKLTTRFPESELMKILRKTQLQALPTLWGLPPAEFHVNYIDEKNCFYFIKWNNYNLLKSSLAGILFGILLSVLFIVLTNKIEVWLFILPILGFIIFYTADLKKKYNLGLEYYRNRISSVNKTEVDIIPIIGILRRMGAVNDEELDKIFSSGIVSGDHLLEMLLSNNYITEEDLIKAKELSIKIKKGNSKAIEALFEAIHGNIDKVRKQSQRIITEDPPIKT